MKIQSAVLCEVVNRETNTINKPTTPGKTYPPLAEIIKQHYSRNQLKVTTTMLSRAQN